MPQQQERLSDVVAAQAPLWLALLPVVLLPQLVGGVHPEVAVGAGLFEWLALAFLWSDARRWRRGVWLSALGLPLLLGAAATALQVAPLPAPLVRLLSPTAFERAQWMTALLPADIATSVHPVLSLDPPESAFALVRLLGAAALFVVVADAGRHRSARTLVYRALLACGLAMFVVALGHRLFHIPGAWGVFSQKSSYFYAPLVNPNQLGRMFGALSLVLIARALVVRSRTETLWFSAVGVLCGAGVFLSYSRGAMVAWVVGGAFLLALLWRHRRGSEGEPTSSVGATAASLAPLALVAALGVGLYLAREAVVKEASSLGHEQIETSKAALYRPALSLLTDFPLTGVGNNAFGSAFGAHAPVGLFGTSLTFTHVENVVVATLVEHGLLVALALFVLAAALAWTCLTRLRARTDFAPMCGVVFLLVGDLFDFVLESTAGIYLLATLLGLGAQALARQAVPVLAWRVRPRILAVAAALCFTAWSLAALPATGRWRERQDREITLARGAEREAAIHRALAAHPADGHYAYLEATAARQRLQPAEALRWANRAMVVWPWHGGAHMEAARALAALGHLEQALLEYRQAWLSGAPAGTLLAEVLERTDDLALRRRAVPATAAALAQLADHLASEGRHAQALAVLDDALGLVDAGDDSAGSGDALRVRAAGLALQLLDAPGAQARLRPLLDAPRVDADVAVLALRAVELERGVGAALDAVAALQRRTRDVGPVLRFKLDAQMRAGRVDAAHATVTELRARAGDRQSLEWLDRQEATLFAAAGDRGRQLRLIERLALRSPSDVGLQLELARLQLGLDLVEQANATATQLARLAPGDARVVQLIDDVRAAQNAALERKLLSPP